MGDEFTSIIRYHTWDLIPHDPSYKLIGSRWIFCTKRNPNGSVEWFKACLVAKGFHQRPGIDYQDTYSPVVKPTTSRIVLGVAVSKDWDIRQLDVNNVFLQGHLTEDVYMAQPTGFIDKDKPNHVCKLRKALYGLKQAPRAWYMEHKNFLLQSEFVNSVSDASLFTLNVAGVIIYVFVYVEDIVITGNNAAKVTDFISILSNRFSLKDQGHLSYFLGIKASRSASGLLITQRKYIVDL